MRVLYVKLMGSLLPCPLARTSVNWIMHVFWVVYTIFRESSIKLVILSTGRKPTVYNTREIEFTGRIK